jgi:hypothetical protein
LQFFFYLCLQLKIKERIVPQLKIYKLNGMDNNDVRWKQRFQNFEKALLHLETA